MADDDLDPKLLDAWPAMPPPAGFADRVFATKPRRRWPYAVAAVAVIALGVSVVALRGGHASSGTLAVDERTSADIGDRGVAVAEAHSELSWAVDASGAVDVEQKRGDVFYRVEHGGPFVIHTPAGDVRVTGTCFRIEVTPMTPTQKMLASGALGAALASAVIITVYEGHVVAETRAGKTELAAGNRASLSPDARPSLVASADPQVVAQQRDEIIHLRAKVATLEKQAGSASPRERDQHDIAERDEGRLWHDPSPETLKEWAAKCHVRYDEPGLDRWSPQTQVDGLDAGELAAYNDTMGELAKEWHDLVRALYLETTNDTAGADTLSVEAMRREIDEKSPRNQAQEALRELSAERAGLAQAPDPAGEPPLMRLLRAQTGLGDRAEAALGKRVGEARAHEIRGDGWGSKSDMSGCPH